ncbi:MAG: 16S rRNA (guanine(966)-N(2))-methyltransferase RsmD [Bacteroidetes bacterium CG2_30_33_31]|nr:MAG: 16S rRNA (guanine(966)-N(2))-methyltransferase RsmD [Bacteroidetes bacterium CG2_30_33_31]
MRIVSGNLGGRKINPPYDLPVRPTTDKAKESLFNILNNRINFEETVALDLFAGTGNISYELASRGCISVTSVEIDFKCVKFIKEASELLKANIKVVQANVFSFLNTYKSKSDLIFADPPYSLENIEEIPDYIFRNELLNEEGILIVEHSANTNFAHHHYFMESRRYSKVHFSFFQIKT